MAGHSKWANIKRQKERVDEKKGKTFTQLSRAIIMAAKHGLPDPAANFQLRTAIEKAKAAGIPHENIERAIAKGAGTYENNETMYEEVRYEGYGLGGVAILIEALTDNRNRTAADLREAFSKNGENLGEIGCVSWMFDQKVVVILEGEVNEDFLLEASVEGGADTYKLFEEEMRAEIFSEVTNLDTLTKTLRKKKINFFEVELRWIPNSIVAVNDPGQYRSILKLVDTLETLDDVQNVTANLEIAEILIEANVA
ncbi:YebC/PmpR family DNA-binding transcriptional regulator [cyanobacterium endosymbiont of Epithemia clementina EcSB]|uniref:YebC/PmpR family DNA-binding transcriptional regulator n=1 Tax=cyanobacterium endosymbiont of Epithemia clementina EcSB TaxID=3034674 RepID=UPI0024802061|nr:YebC/PmpR family DNA-binding transcriptional regulator [cyanobacterium endosymbiont of Epithemia clementina EcSB]WGT67756.1 YebC/PmpR family DNA-binding transcriptional regulator [cyanobacterium endosymbiont of Epithemia clementina EcSB]